MELVGTNVRSTLVNGIDGDPAVYNFFVQSGDAALFDAGSLEALSNRDLLKVRHVFISHTHIDHFIGFDRLLRVNVPHFRKIEVCGPKGIINNVQGKLHGFLWNLLEKGQIEFIVRELSETGELTSVRLINDDHFKQNRIDNPEPATGPSVRPLPDKPGGFLTNLNDGTRVEGVCLDHGTPSIAYVFQAPLKFNVNTNELDRLGLKPGPWIRELQIALANGKFDEKLSVDGKDYVSRDLGSEIMTYKAPRILGYVTDIRFSRENLERMRPILQDVEILICESNFSVEDSAKARQKKHLTTKQAALIAAHCAVDRLQVFHISNIYSGKQAEIATQAQEFFAKFKALPEAELEKLVEAEIATKD